jgi:hypothetical protein
MQQDTATPTIHIAAAPADGGVPGVQVYNGGKQWLAQDASKA